MSDHNDWQRMDRIAAALERIANAITGLTIILAVIFFLAVVVWH